jgi:hypothetical protein
MKSPIAHIEDLFKKLGRRKRAPVGKEEGVHLNHDWEWFLTGLFVFSLCAIILGVYTFYNLGYGVEERGVSTLSPQNSLNRQKLESVIAAFEQKRVKFNTLRSSGVTVPTP